MASTFNGGYGRIGQIWVAVAECALCKKQALCLRMDASESEYRAGSVCRTCAEKMFDNPAEYREEVSDDSDA